MNIPSWFEDFRPILIPRDFFKAVALLLGSANVGHNGYLFGEWSPDGWWYYYPVAFALKTPIALLALIAGALIILLRRTRTYPVEQLVPWIAAGIFFALAMHNKMDIGVRHLLPVYGLLAVAVASRLAPLRGPGSRDPCSGGLAGRGSAFALVPFTLNTSTSLLGSTRNGYKYLLDSNLDWGQDVKRLKKYLVDHDLTHFYLTYFGVEKALTYYGLQYTTVEATEARNLPRGGTLVISAMALIQPGMGVVARATLTSLLIESAIHFSFIESATNALKRKSVGLKESRRSIYLGLRRNGPLRCRSDPS